VIQQLDIFIKALGRAMLPVEAGACLADLAETFGFPESVIVALLWPQPSLPVFYWRSAGDPEDYARTNSPAHNPLAQYAFAVDVPFDVPTASAALGYSESDVRRALYPTVKDKHIVIFPVHRHGSFAMYTGCAGDSPDDTPHTRALLHAAAHATYDVIVALAPNRELTQRESACLKAIASGLSYVAAGKTMGIAERTVRAAVASAKRKLNAQTQSEVIAKAMSASLRPPRGDALAVGPVGLVEARQMRRQR
jgi:DNA-binding CsgD family transcriptional regulator